MTRIPIFVSALTASMVLAASPLASATGTQPISQADMSAVAMCGERAAVLSELEQQFDEAPVAVGQVDASAVVEILVSESGSWTILATGTDGMSCIVSAGEGFESTMAVSGLDV